MSTVSTPIAVDETAFAQSIGMSVAWLRKDRRGKRLIPFYRIGGAIRYDLGRARDALVALEEGGTHLNSRAMRSGGAA